ncbi:MAG TPA: hypothetical protein DEB40_01050 [Elusimicrobia bacterium]|nr:hypothetical protein [Elusimicrobiota bacterium]HBT60317.1 hypothetical protein [Elusimicrobiota bacterium]
MHDASHEERLLLMLAGDLPPLEAARFKAESAACPGCREFAAAMGAASELARGAAGTVPAWLDGRVLARSLGPARNAWAGWRWSPLGLGLAMAAAVLMLAPWKAGQESLSWSNGIESELARMDNELADISRSMAISADRSELESDIGRVEESARILKNEKF